MKKRVLTPKEKARFKSIWKRAHKEGELFDRYDMNFVLCYINDLTDLIEQALELKNK